MSQPATTAFRVLLIEDSPGDRFLLREMIERGSATQFRVVQVTDTLARGMELAAREEADVVLLDFVLSDAKGLEAFDRIHEAVPQMPVIVLSERDDEELALHAVQRVPQTILSKAESTVISFREPCGMRSNGPMRRRHWLENGIC